MAASSTAVATLTERPPRSVLADMAERYGMEPAAFEATVRATVVKGACTREEFAAFMLVAKEYHLNPLTKEVYAFPGKGGGIVPVVSVDGWARIINDHPMLDGITFVDQMDQAGELVSITCNIFRKDRSHPVAIPEYMAECRMNTDVWKKWPRRMLRHKALIQASRIAFGFSGIYDQDEYERMTGQGAPVTAYQPGTALHADFALPAAPEPANDQDGGAELEAAEAEFIDAYQQVANDIAATDAANDAVPFDVLTWAAELNLSLKTYSDIDVLREDFKAHFPELKEQAPSLAKALNQAVAQHATDLANRSKTQ